MCIRDREAESGFTFNGSGVQIGTGNPFIHLKDTTNNTDAYVQSDDNGSIYLKADDNAESGSSKIVLQVDGSEKVRIDSSGNLLLGTTTSSENLRLAEKFAIVGHTNVQYPGMNITNYNSANSGSAGLIDFQRSRSCLLYTSPSPRD